MPMLQFMVCHKIFAAGGKSITNASVLMFACFFLFLVINKTVGKRKAVLNKNSLIRNKMCKNIDKFSVF